MLTDAIGAFGLIAWSLIIGWLVLDELQAAYRRRRRKRRR